MAVGVSDARKARLMRRSWAQKEALPLIEERSRSMYRSQAQPRGADGARGAGGDGIAPAVASRGPCAKDAHNFRVRLMEHDGGRLAEGSVFVQASSG